MDKIKGEHLDAWLPSDPAALLGADYAGRTFSRDGVAYLLDYFRREPDRAMGIDYQPMETEAGWFGDPERCMDLASEILECDQEWLDGLDLDVLAQHVPYYVFSDGGERTYWNIHWNQLLGWLLSIYRAPAPSMAASEEEVVEDDGAGLPEAA